MTPSFCDPHVAAAPKNQSHEDRVSLDQQPVVTDLMCCRPRSRPKWRASRLARGVNQWSRRCGAKPTKHYCFVSLDVRSDLRIRAKHLLSAANAMIDGSST